MRGEREWMNTKKWEKDVIRKASTRSNMHIEQWNNYEVASSTICSNNQIIVNSDHKPPFAEPWISKWGELLIFLADNKRITEQYKGMKWIFGPKSHSHAKWDESQISARTGEFREKSR